MDKKGGEGKAEKESARLLNEASAIEQNIELMKTREEILANKGKKAGLDSSRTDGPSVTYHLANKLSVPSQK